MARAYYKLLFPEDLKHDAVLTFINNLGGLPNSDRARDGSAVVFEIWSTKSGIYHRLGLPEAHPHLLDQLRTAIPGINIEQNDEPPTTGFAFVGEYAMSSDISPLNIKDPAATAASLLTSLRSITDPGEAAVLQFVVTPTDKKAPQERKKFKPVMGSGRGGIWGMSASVVSAFGGAIDEKLEEQNKTKIDRAKNKWDGYMFAAMPRIAVRARSQEGLTRQMHSIYNALQAAAGHDVSFEVQTEEKDSDAATKNLLAGSPPPRKWQCLFNAQELSALVAFPIDSPSVPGLTLGGSFQSPPSNDIPTEGLKIARSTYNHEDRPLAVPWPETLRHFYTVGSTGSGKTTLLENMAEQVMAQGAGLVYLDPKGDSAKRLLDRIPKERVKDVMYFNPTDKEAVIGINLFEGSTENPDLYTDNIIGMFKSFYKDSWGDRLAYNLLGAVRTVATIPDSTLLDVSSILSNERYRNQVLERYHLSVTLRDFWDEYNDMSKALRMETIAPIMNKLQPFSMRDDVRHVIAQVHPSMNMDDALAHNKIVIARLPKGDLGNDTASLLGSMLMVQLWQAVQRRPEKDRGTPFYCFVDECQDFMNLPTPLGAVLSQGRGYGFGLILANQHTEQLDTKMRHDVLANANSFAFFKLSAADAKIVTPQFGSFLKPAYFTNLGTHEVIVSISTGGQTRSRPTVGKTYAPGDPAAHSAAILANNKARYAHSRVEVEADIERRREELHKRPIIGSREVTEDQ